VSIIEKAAGKLDQIEKREQTSPHEAEAKAPSGGHASIIEKAATEIDRIERTEESVSPEAALELPKHPNHKVTSESKASDTGINPALSLGGRVSKQGMINLTKLRQLGMIIPDGERSQIAEEFRLIKRPLLMNAFNQGATPVNNGNLIMVTSALAGEGKTFCAANLAMSIAMELDHTVLLVDADVARPSIPGYLGLEMGRGLLDVLLDDKLDLSDVLIKTNVETLSILQAGTKHKRATELLASQAMSDLLKEIARRYPDRVVIFDSPPLLLTSESHVLANQMGQIVMVVAAESTTQQAIKEALRQIETCDVINLIYNKAREFSGGEYYGYYG
jgi:exopolysaccharide/PEP-CTERM locus tyrosine autokinase